MSPLSIYLYLLFLILNDRSIFSAFNISLSISMYITLFSFVFIGVISLKSLVSVYLFPLYVYSIDAYFSMN